MDREDLDGAIARKHHRIYRIKIKDPPIRAGLKVYLDKKDAYYIAKETWL
jgi:hypothetical protein